MATIVNTTPAQTDNSGNGYGFLIGVMLLILFVMALLFYGLPFLRNSMITSNPQINVPGKIDVNVNQPGK